MLKSKTANVAEASKQIKTEDPYVIKLGTTKVSWQNFQSMCEAHDRKLDHMMSYISAETGVEATLGPENNMIL